MQKLLIPLAIVLSGLIIAVSNLYVGGRLSNPFLAGLEKDKADKASLGATPTPTVTPRPIVAEIPVGNSPFLGKETAPVTVIEFSDFQCPFCAAVFGIKNEAEKVLKNQDPTWEAALPLLNKEYVEKGLVKFVYKDFAFLGDESKAAANAALCALDQGKFWQYHDALFENQKGENQGAFADANLKKFAKTLELNESKFGKCVEERSHSAQVEEGAGLLRAFAVSQNIERLGTPFFLVNNKSVGSGAVSYKVLKDLIEAELAKK